MRHTGLAFGFIPVILDDEYAEMEGRYWWSDILFDYVALPIFDLCVAIRQFADPEWEPEGFPVRITGDIE